MKNKLKNIFWFFSSFIILAEPMIASTIEDFEYPKKIDHSHCQRIGDFCHHHEEGLACLAKQKLSKEDLTHFMKKHLGNDIFKLNLSHQTELDSPILIEGLASNPRGAALVYLNLSCTNAGYSGIVELLKSSIFGSLRNDYPTYDQYSGLPVSVIKIEIANSLIYKQYIDGKIKYPLPVVKNFQIIYGHRCNGKPSIQIGFKQILLLNNGEQLKNN